MVYVHVQVHTFHGIHVEVREQVSRVVSFLPWQVVGLKAVKLVW